MIIETCIGLRCHPTNCCEEVRGIQVRVRRTSAELELNFLLDGDISAIYLAPEREPRAFVELWRHTCFEVFVMVDHRAGYHEFNFAPSGEWQTYAFSAYRHLEPLSRQLRPPTVSTMTTPERLELRARFFLSDLSPIHPYSRFRLGLAAVIERRDGTLSYFALHHSQGKPDFHHPDTFALLLDAP
jgi:hypothetical protein